MCHVQRKAKDSRQSQKKENGQLLNFFSDTAVTGFPRRQLAHRKYITMPNSIQIFTK